MSVNLTEEEIMQLACQPLLSVHPLDLCKPGGSTLSSFKGTESIVDMLICSCPNQMSTGFMLFLLTEAGSFEYSACGNQNAGGWCGSNTSLSEKWQVWGREEQGSTPALVSLFVSGRGIQWEVGKGLTSPVGSSKFFISFGEK